MVETDIASGSITQTYGNSVIHAVALNMDDGEITYYANGSVVSGLNQVDLDGLDGEIFLDCFCFCTNS